MLLQKQTSDGARIDAGPTAAPEGPCTVGGSAHRFRRDSVVLWYHKCSTFGYQGKYEWVLNL